MIEKMKTTVGTTSTPLDLGLLLEAYKKSTARTHYAGPIGPFPPVGG